MNLYRVNFRVAVVAGVVREATLLVETSLPASVADLAAVLVEGLLQADVTVISWEAIREEQMAHAG